MSAGTDAEPPLSAQRAREIYAAVYGEMDAQQEFGPPVIPGLDLDELAEG
jgi:hypothetical protein